MKKITLHLLCGIITGFLLCGLPTVSAQAAQTSGSTEATTGSDSSIAEEIEELILEGKFYSSSLTNEQLNYIYEAYDGDPQALTELQKQSDSNKASLSTVNTSSYSHDSQFDGYDVINGIDISVWQGTIDWEAVKADGIDFALIRVAYRGYGDAGTLGTDTMYEQNIEGALAAGLDVGVYIYSQAITTDEAKEEADYILNLISGYDINLPVVLDYEYAGTGVGRLYNAGLTVDEATDICKAFCKRVENKNYTAMVYANKSMLTSSLNASSIAKLYPIWLAQYPSTDSETGTIHATYTGTYSYWQYTSSGSVSGISGNVDMNFRYITNPTAVTNLALDETDTTSTTFTWDKVSGVYGYKIYRLNDSTGQYEAIGTTVGAGNTTYTDNSVAVESTYTYMVRAFYKLTNGDIYGANSNEISAITSPKAISDLSVTKENKKAIKLSWTAQTDVSGYCIMRSTSRTSGFEIVGYAEGASTKTYKDTGLNPGTVYYYRIAAYTDQNGVKDYYANSNVTSGTTLPGQVTGLTYTSTKSSISLSWNAQVNVNGYKVYVKSGSKWKLLKTIKKATKSTYEYTGLKTNTVYKFSVIAYYTSGSGTINTKRSATLSAVTATTAVKNFTVTPLTKKSAKLTWSKSSNVTGYIIQAKASDSTTWTNVKTIKSSTKTSYTVSGLKVGVEYTFRIRPYRESGGVAVVGAAAKTTIKITPDVVTNVTINEYESGYVLSWKIQKNVSGYYVYKYNVKKDEATKVATIDDANTNSCIVTKASNSNIKYYVVAYNKYGNKKFKGNNSEYAEITAATQTVKVTTSTLNVRKGAGTSYGIVSSVKKGTVLTIKDVEYTKDNDWYYVTFTKNGKKYKGYVSSSYVKMIIN